MGQIASNASRHLSEICKSDKVRRESAS